MLKLCWRSTSATRSRLPVDRLTSLPPILMLLTLTFSTNSFGVDSIYEQSEGSQVEFYDLGEETSEPKSSPSDISVSNTSGLAEKAPPQMATPAPQTPRIDSSAKENLDKTKLGVESLNSQPIHKRSVIEASQKKDPIVAPKSESTRKISADQSLRWLTNGNTRYVKMKFRSDGRHQVDRDRTKVTQTPHAILLSCSDSRVPPELIFDQAIGEIFVIRVAGPSLDDVVIASIESAVQSFSPQLLLVLGHTSCPLIEEAITKKQVHQDNDRSSHQTTITTDIRNRLNSATPASQQSANFSDAARVNAASIGTELIHKSTIIKREVEAGRLTIQHALYSVETGRVSFEK